MRVILLVLSIMNSIDNKIKQIFFLHSITFMNGVLYSKTKIHVF